MPTIDLNTRSSSADESSPAAPARKPLTDSPWFWLHLFAAGGLVALFLMTPKFGSRQSQIERKYQGRTQALLPAEQRDPALVLSTSDHTIITLAPLYAGLAAIFVMAWIMLWRQNFRRPTTASSPPLETASPP